MVDARASEIAHRGVAICNPISSQTMDRIIDRTDLAPGGFALDIGCGKGEFLMRLAERYDVTARGVDVSAARIAEASEVARRRKLQDRVSFHCQDAKQLAPPPSGLALAACIGATHALGGLEGTVLALSSWTRPAGWVVIGEGFWMRAPDPSYLAALGAEPDELGRDGWVEEEARRAGLESVGRWTSTIAEWDAYESAVLRGIEAYVRATPNDPSGAKMLDDQRAFHEAQLRWGRSTMGFAVHLFKKTR